MQTERNSHVLGRSKWQRPTSRQAYFFFFNYKAREVLLRSTKEIKDVFVLLESTENHVHLRLLCCHTELQEIISLSYFLANWEIRTGNEHSNESNEDINLENYKYSHKAKHECNAFIYAPCQTLLTTCLPGLSTCSASQAKETYQSLLPFLQ